MSQRKSLSKSRGKGFSLIEVLVSIVILSIGLLGVALMISSTIVSGTRAKFMSMANVLASEKLDSLNKWPSSGTTNTTCDPNICAGGSLTGPENCAAGDIYCDQITVNEASGVDYETQTQTTGTPPVTTTTTIVHTSSGCIDTPTNCGVADPVGGSTFTRRWLITTDPSVTTNGASSTITGVRRITVVVTLNNPPANQPVAFQMSTVRP
ncbi:MAG: type IV pilus modification PilV family protein [Candidatus Acidiferrales bacterium]